MNIIIRLPRDIVSRIIPYTYQIQKRELLNDIVHFNTSRTFLLELYYSYFIKFSYLIHQDDVCWLVNDMLGYMNNHYAIGHVLTCNFINIYCRHPFIKTREDVVKYMSYLDNKPINSQVNIYLGLLNIRERDEFTSIAVKQFV